MLLALDLSAYIPIALLIVMAILFAAVNIIGTHLLGPSPHGESKDIAYESGMNPIGTARKRFNVRFYIVAMIFLVFDVEIVFMYPWATIFAPMARTDIGPMLLWEMVIFVGILLVAYLYAWGKGVFRWD